MVDQIASSLFQNQIRSQGSVSRITVQETRAVFERQSVSVEGPDLQWFRDLEASEYRNRLSFFGSLSSQGTSNNAINGFFDQLESNILDLAGETGKQLSTTLTQERFSLTSRRLDLIALDSGQSSLFTRA